MGGEERQPGGPPTPSRGAWSREKAGAVAAALSALAGLGALAGSLAISPWFVWHEDALSDLGHPRHESWVLFGGGLALSGALFLGFVWGLARVVPRTGEGTFALLLLGAGGASLSAIGVINESWGPPHFIVSLTYFTFVPLGMVFLARALASSSSRYAAATTVLALVAGAFGLTILTAIRYGAPFSSQAVPELIASALLAGWSLWTGALLAYGRFTRARRPSR